MTCEGSPPHPQQSTFRDGRVGLFWGRESTVFGGKPNPRTAKVFATSYHDTAKCARQDATLSHQLLFHISVPTAPNCSRQEYPLSLSFSPFLSPCLGESIWDHPMDPLFKRFVPLERSRLQKSKESGATLPRSTSIHHFVPPCSMQHFF